MARTNKKDSGHYLMPLLNAAKGGRKPTKMQSEEVFMAEFPVELLKGHDNSSKGFDALAFVELPNWLAHQLDGLSKDARGKYRLFQVVAETEKAYKIIYCRDASRSWNFCRPTWYVNYVSKSLAKSVRTDVEEYIKEEHEYYKKLYSEDLK